MPKSTPNRVNQPYVLESLRVPLADITQDPGLYLPYMNRLDDSIMASEFVLAHNRVCLTRRTILPGKEGTLVLDWQADVFVDPNLAAKIYVNDVVYLDYDIDDLEEGVGALTNVQPTNGFIVGRAVETPGMSYLDGTDKVVACDIGWLRCRVMPLTTATTKYGTVPDFTNTYV